MRLLWFDDERLTARRRRVKCKKFRRWRDCWLYGSCIAHWNEITIQVGQSSRLHRLATAAATSRNQRYIDSIVGFVKPFIFSLATVQRISIVFAISAYSLTYSKTQPTPTHETIPLLARTFSNVRLPPSL